MSAAALLLAGASAQAETGNVELGTHYFHEPSATSALSVVTPTAALSVTPWEGFGVTGSYEADIVSGATEAVKQGPIGGADVVSAATGFRDVRHSGGGGLRLTRDQTELEASYGYGTESDYRSHAVSVAATTSFFQRNTEIQFGYGHGFDRVCTTNFRAADAPSTRVALDDSAGCFASASTHALRRINLDNFQLGWTQSWTPVLTTQLVATGALQNGFLENPYRSVVISSVGDQALENHPENRARMALALRAKFYARPLKTAFGVGVLGYDDTWDVLAQSYEISAERHLVAWLALKAEGRFSTQTGALFYSDDYTGGEPLNGPRGQYWTGDRELSPLRSYWLGAHLTGDFAGREGNRLLSLFLRFKFTLGASMLKTELQNFTLAGRDADDTLGLLFGANVQGAF